MSIDYDGGMIVGEMGGNISPDSGEFDSMSEWAEENGMKQMSTLYEAEPEWCYYGFEVKDVLISDIDQAWIDDLRSKAAKFEQLTGTPAKLLGAINIF